MEQDVPHNEPVQINGGEKSENLLDCCIVTIEAHGEHNPMMVCDKCKQIVKTFSSEKAFEHYVKFCEGRGRCFKTGKCGSYDVITFNVYDTFNK